MENPNLEVPAQLTRRDTTSFGAWLAAKVFASRLDRQVEAGAPVLSGSALAIHVARLTSRRERELIARALQSHLREAFHGFRGPSARVAVNRAGVIDARDVIDEVTRRLQSSDPVRARGMARLRMLLSDGAGPLYTPWRGSVAAELRGALAVLEPSAPLH